MKFKRDRRTLRASQQPAFQSQPAVVPTRPVVFDELRRRGLVHVMGDKTERTGPGRRRPR